MLVRAMLVFCSCSSELFGHVGCLVGMKMQMGFLLRQYPWPLAMWVVSKKGSQCQPQREKVPTCRFLAKKEGVWCDLSTKGADSWNFGKKGSHVVQPLQRKKDKKKTLKWVYNTYNRFHSK